MVEALALHINFDILFLQKVYNKYLNSRIL